MNGSYDSKMADYWTKIIREKRDDFRTYVTDPALFKKLDSLDKNQVILDVGCGEGYVSRYLTKKGHTVIGLDLSEHMIKSAKEMKFGSEKYVQGDVTNVDFDDAYFDVVVSNFLLMELENPEDAIKEVSRVLKKGGRFIFQGLHPFVFTSNTGETGGKKVSLYFQKQKFSEKFVVDGLESPREAVRYHHPLSVYTNALSNNGFLIKSIEEPCPIESTPKNNLIRNVFEEPWILLFDALKD